MGGAAPGALRVLLDGHLNVTADGNLTMLMNATADSGWADYTDDGSGDDGEKRSTTKGSMTTRIMNTAMTAAMKAAMTAVMTAVMMYLTTLARTTAAMTAVTMTAATPPMATKVPRLSRVRASTRHGLTSRIAAQATFGFPAEFVFQ